MEPKPNVWDYLSPEQAQAIRNQALSEAKEDYLTKLENGDYDRKDTDYSNFKAKLKQEGKI